MGYSQEKITALILAGGEGTRLRQAVPNMPKVIAPVDGRPFIHFLIDQISNFGVDHIVVCTGYCGSEVRDAIGLKRRSIKIDFSQEQEKLGTGGAIRFALPFIHSDKVLVLNGDSYCDFDFKTFHEWHCSHSLDCSLVVVKQPETKRFGLVQMSEKDQIEAFIEKGENPGQSIPSWINAGAYLISTKLIELIPEGREISLESELFTDWMNRGLLFGYKTTGKFIDIGTPESYSSATEFMQLERKSKST